MSRAPTIARELQHWEKFSACNFYLELDGVYNKAVFANASCECCFASVPTIQLGCSAAVLSPEGAGLLARRLQVCSSTHFPSTTALNTETNGSVPFPWTSAHLWFRNHNAAAKPITFPWCFLHLWVTNPAYIELLFPRCGLHKIVLHFVQLHFKLPAF